MARITWTDEAGLWVREIYAYIAADSPAAVWRVISAIYQRVELLQQFPRMGHRYEDITNREVRILLYGHYRIAYLLKSNGDIDILGVYHGALNIDRLLK